MLKVRRVLASSMGLALVLAAFAIPAQAAPGNDRIGDATEISLTGNLGSASFTTAQATRENSEYLGSDSSFQNTV